MSLREQILAIQDRKPIPIAVPEWDGITLYVAQLSARQQIEYAEAIAAMPEDVSYAHKKALLVIYGTQDETGAPVFSAQDIPALVEKNWKVIDRLSEAVIATIAAVSEAKKNSSATTAAAS